jgi:glycosyltransferase involved in cell wall biosynthesis
MSNKRICFFNTNKAWGGGEKWHYRNALAFRDNGYDVMAIAQVDSPLADQWVQENIDLCQIHNSNLSFLNILALLKVRRVFQEYRIATVFLNLSSDLKLGGIAAKLAGVKQIIYRRGQALPVRNSFFNKFLLKNVATHIIANSSEIKRNILINNPALVPDNKIHVIYNGIDLTECRIEPKFPLYHKKSSEIVLGNAGRLVEQKGQKYLIELAHALKKDGIRFKLIVAGEGPLEKDLKEYASQLNVHDQMVFTGFVTDIKAFMDSIDIFVLTSIHEGSANTLLEAMAYEKPVIAFDISSNSEIIQDHLTGFLVEFPSVIKMAARIIILQKDELLRNTMGKNGRALVSQQYAFKNSFEKLMNMVKNNR